VPEARAANLRAFGMDDRMTARTIARIEDLDRRAHAQIASLLAGAPAPTDLGDALCGRRRDVRPPDGALGFLVEETQGERQAIRIERVAMLAAQPWANASPIAASYEHTEMAPERQRDATVMTIAAVLARRENDALTESVPWGRGDGWSWEGVVAQHPAIEERIVAYFALMHLVVEIATDEGGICGRK
jgi:hypothetical protein